MGAGRGRSAGKAAGLNLRTLEIEITVREILRLHHLDHDVAGNRVDAAVEEGVIRRVVMLLNHFARKIE